jgi:hypothetical protein
MAKKNRSANAVNKSEPDRFKRFHTAADNGCISGGGEARVLYVDAQASVQQLADVARARLATLLTTMRVFSTCRSEVALDPLEVIECLLPCAEEVEQLLAIISDRVTRDERAAV